MKAQNLFYLLSNAKNKQEFIQILQKNRIPLNKEIEIGICKSKTTKKKRFY